MSGEGPLIWVKRTELLAFRFGRHRLARLAIPVLSLETPCTALSTDIDATLAHLPELPPDCQAVVLPAHPIDAKPPRVRGLFGPSLQYLFKSGPRQLIDLRGAFPDYLRRFRHDQRYWLIHKTRKLADLSGGSPDWKLFDRGENILEFQRAVLSISPKTYQAGIGIGFADLGISPDELRRGADLGLFRGYVLYLAGKPASYLFFRAQGSNLQLAHMGYDPAFAKSSPGIVLLWIAIQTLFEEKKFSYLDLLWGEYRYKRLLATTTIRVAAVLCFRNTLRNKLLVAAHCVTTALSRWMVYFTGRLGIAGRLMRVGDQVARRR